MKPKRSKNFAKDTDSDDDWDDPYIPISPKKKRKLHDTPQEMKHSKSKKELHRSLKKEDKGSGVVEKLKLVKKKEKENEFSKGGHKKHKKSHSRSRDVVLENVRLNANTKKNVYSTSDSESSSTEEDESSDSDLDDIFKELKKHGVKTDTSKSGKRSKGTASSNSSPSPRLEDRSSKKIKPELEKSPTSLILNHKRISRKRFPTIQEEEPVKPKKHTRSEYQKTSDESNPLPLLNKHFGDYESPLLINLTKNLLKDSKSDDSQNIGNRLLSEIKIKKKDSKCELMYKSPDEDLTWTPTKNFSSQRRKSHCESVYSEESPKRSRKGSVAGSKDHTSRDICNFSTPKSHKHRKRSRDDSGNSSYLSDNCSFSKTIAGDKLQSPTTPSSKAISRMPTTPLEKARTSLHVSAVPESLPCREREFKSIYSFLENRLLDGIGGNMYISGVPGTGKSATVNQVVKKLTTMADNGLIPEFKFIEINGMRLVEPRKAYIVLWRCLSGKKEKISVDQAQEKLDKWFGKMDGKVAKIPTVLLVDELDLICTKKQDVVYNLLDWSTKSSSRLIVLTIANTMDMPERLFKGRVTSRMGLTRLTFMPYTYKQLEEIVLTRLSGLDAFTLDAVRLVSRKVAAVSGDARRSLDICRRATELPAVDETVKISHIEQAIREMTNSNIVRVIRGCSELEKLFLRAVSEVSSRHGVEEVDMRDVVEHFLTLCTLEGFSRIPVSHILSISNRLKCYRLIFINNPQNGILQRLILNVTQDDVHYGLCRDS